MPSSFPGDLDNFGAPVASGDVISADLDNLQSEALYAVESNLGTNAQGSFGTVRDNIAAKAAITSVQNNAYNSAADTGTVNHFAVTLSPPITAYEAGMTITFVAGSTNTAGVDLNVNGVGAVNIYKNVNQALAAGNIEEGQVVVAIFDGENFQTEIATLSLTLPISIADGGTDATTAPAALSNLGAAASGANSDITSMSGLSGPLKAPTQVNDVNGNAVLSFASVSSAVNDVTVTNAATDTAPTIAATGSDANVDLNLQPKGSGVVQVNDGNGNTVTSFSSMSGAVNDVTVTNAAPGTAPSIGATGSDSNISLNLRSKGSGVVQVNGSEVYFEGGPQVSITDGGTGASTANGARANLGAAASGANGDVTSLSGLTTPLSLGQGGTGAATAGGARSNLGAAASGPNSDITSLSGLTTPLSVAQGGSGAATAGGARSNLGAAASGANSDISSMSGLSGALQAPSQVNDGNGNAVLSFGSVSSAVNDVTVTNAATDNAPTIAATGSDANIDLNLQPKGSGVVQINDGNRNTVTSFGSVSSAVNDVTLTNAATGTAPSIGATGSDSNISLNLMSKGSGTVQVNGAEVYFEGGPQVAITDGGTGASTASGARANLGAAASGANSDISSLTGLTTPLSLGQGGTDSSTAAGARANLGAAASGANSDITSLSGLTTPLSLGQGGTGSTTAGGARGNLGAAASGANSDITSLSALSTPLSIAQGGSGATTAGAARSNLGAAASSANSDITSMSGLSGALQAPSQVNDVNGHAVLSFGSVGSAVNDVTVTNAATGKAPTIDATGSDANIDLNLQPKGSGAVQINDGNGNAVTSFSSVSSAVNAVTVTNAATGTAPSIGVTGSDSNISLNLLPKGSGTVQVNGSEVYFEGGPQVAVTDGGTGANSATGARANLSAARLGNNTDITEMTGLSGPLQAPTQVNDGNGNAVLVFESAGGAVNEVTITNAATTHTPSIAATGSDTNISLNLQTQGTGVVQVNGAEVYFEGGPPVAIADGGTGATSAPLARTNLSAARLGSNSDITELTGLSGPLQAPTQVNDGNGNAVLVFGSASSAVNEVTVTNAATGNAPAIAAAGTDTNINLNLQPKGSGSVQVNDGNGNTVTSFGSVSGAVNDVTVTNAATGTAPSIGVSGSDSNISLNLTSKGSGTVQVNGNVIFSLHRDRFTGDGSTTHFTLSHNNDNPGTEYVSRGGIIEDPDNYTATSTQIQFSSAPASGEVVLVWYQT